MSWMKEPFTMNGRRRLLTLLAMSLFLCLAAFGATYGEALPERGRIQRLTVSQEEAVNHPSMDAEGTTVIYRAERIGPKGERIRSIHLLRRDDRKPRTLFTDGTLKAPKPHADHFLLCGTKPPILSGDGRKAVFSLSIGAPLFLEDRYLAVVHADGSDLQVLPIRNDAIAEIDWRPWGLADEFWRTISQYRVSHDGKWIACLVKGHQGARELGSPSGIVVLQSDGMAQKTLMQPKLERTGWRWEGFPRRPFTGGGWVFDLSGDGKTILFGAQSSSEKEDYDLYTIGTDGRGLKRITEIRDRWFVRGDLSDDGRRICFFYSGKKLDGPGSYLVGSAKEGIHRLTSRMTDRVDFEEMSGDGRRIVYRVHGKGLAVAGIEGEETLFLEEGRGESDGIRGSWDFPDFPSFWNPRFLSARGDRALLEAVPIGKDRREVFMVDLVPSEKELRPLTCPACGRPMDPGWKYCPYDGKALRQGTRSR